MSFREEWKRMSPDDRESWIKREQDLRADKRASVLLKRNAIRVPRGSRNQPRIPFKEGSGVYLISDGNGHVKIGVFKGTPDDRLSGLQIGNPRVLSILEYKYCYHPRAEEKRLHRKYLHLHVRGEWFLHTPEICLEDDPGADGYTNSQV